MYSLGHREWLVWNPACAAFRRLNRQSRNLPFACAGWICSLPLRSEGQHRPPYFLICAATPLLINAIALGFELPLRRNSEN